MEQDFDQQVPTDPVLDSLQKFLADEDLVLERIKTEINRFNPFNVTEDPKQPASHSRFWAWILDPSGSHNCGPWFLNRFAQSVYHLPLEVKNRISLADHSKTKVHFGYNHKDISIENTEAGWVLLVDNRVEDGPALDQSALQYQLHSQKQLPEPAYAHYILLSPRPFDARRMPGLDGYDTFLYGEALYMLEEGLELLKPDREVADFIRFYIKYFKQQFMTTGKDLMTLAQQIYWKHKDALDFIMKHRPVLNVPDNFQEVFRFFKDDERYAILTPQKDEIFRFLPSEVQDKFRYGSFSWHHMYEMFCLEMVFEAERIDIRFTFGGIWHKDPERREQLQEIKDRLFDEMQHFSSLDGLLTERGHPRSKYPAVASYHLMNIEDLQEFNGQFHDAFKLRFEEFERDVLGPWVEEVLDRIPDRQETQGGY